MKKIIKEPLVHFLLIGVLLFIVYQVINPKQKDNEILLDDNLINELVSKWQLKRNRKPTMVELKGLVNQYVEQEVLYREALLMKLDHNDEIVKRRLAQKMEFISDGLAESLQPTTDMILDYYNKNKKNYRKPSFYSLQVVYFSEDKRNNALEDAKKALKSKRPEILGDNISLPNKYINESAFNIKRDYGTVFIKALDTLKVGKWKGPIYSGFGVHIIKITEKKPSGYFTLEQVAERVMNHYNFDASSDFKKELITSLLEKYIIEINLKNKELKNELNEAF